MQVARWGNSLAIRIPARVADMLQLKEGDDVEITAVDQRTLVIEADGKLSKALEDLRALGWKFPDGYRFRREDAYE